MQVHSTYLTHNPPFPPIPAYDKTNKRFYAECVREGAGEGAGDSAAAFTAEEAEVNGWVAILIIKKQQVNTVSQRAHVRLCVIEGERKS